MKHPTLYKSGNDRIAYNADDSYLTVWHGPDSFDILIGPIGLIEVGLELCHWAQGYGDDFAIYDHPDGVFHIEVTDEGNLYFVEGNRTVEVAMTDDDMLDLGLALIEHGHSLRMTFGDSDEPRYGGRVTFGDTPPDAEIEFNNRFNMWAGEVPTGPYSGGHLDDLDEALDRLTKEREEMRVKFGVAA